MIELDPSGSEQIRKLDTLHIPELPSRVKKIFKLHHTISPRQSCII